VFLYRQEHVRCIDRLLRKKIVSTIVTIQKRWRRYLLLRRRRVEVLRERAVAMRRQMEEDEIRREEETIRREKEEREEHRHREEEERRKEECSVQIQRAFRGYDVRKVGWVWKCLCVLALLSSRYLNSSIPTPLFFCALQASNKAKSYFLTLHLFFFTSYCLLLNT
jgi:IQ calmodulin-binding motif